MNLVGQEIVQHLKIALSADNERKNNTVVKWVNSEDQLPGFANPPPTHLELFRNTTAGANRLPICGGKGLQRAVAEELYS